MTIRPVLFQLSSQDEQSRCVTLTASTPDFVLTYEDNDEGQPVEVYEAITEWVLDRYLSNPVILWAHDPSEPPIGRAEEVYSDETGLVLKIKFASERVTPRAEQAWQGIREGMIRTASVGFRILEILSEEIIDGITHRKVRAELSETSIVPVPADPKALARASMSPDGTLSALSLDDAERELLAEAAKLLRSKRKPKAAVTLDSDDAVRLDFGTLGKAKLTPSGGARIPARFTRTGVLSYRMADGSIRRELRHPEDVFDPESIASLQSCTVTDDHPYQYDGIVDADNWKELSIGHVEAPSKEGEIYLSGEVIVQDGKALDQINQGDRADTSAGYRCKFEMTPGEYEGEAYDVRQRLIRYNHVALLPPGRGRAGRDVSLRLDSFDAVCITEDKTMKFFIKLDGKDIEVPEAVKLRMDALETEADDAKAKTEEERKRADKLRAEADAKEAEDRKRAEEVVAEEDAKEETEEETAESERKVRSRVRLLLRALRFLDEEDETKLDSLSEREIMVKAIQVQSPDFTGMRTDAKDAPESDDYVRARFDLLGSVRADSMDALVGKLQKATPKNADPIQAARQEMENRNKNAWRTPA